VTNSHFHALFPGEVGSRLFGEGHAAAGCTKVIGLAFVFMCTPRRVLNIHIHFAYWVNGCISFASAKQRNPHQLHLLLAHVRFPEPSPHYNPSVGWKKGVHPKVVQERLGHKDIETTLNTYSHVSNSMQREASDKFDLGVDVELPRLETAKANKHPSRSR